MEHKDDQNGGRATPHDGAGRDRAIGRLLRDPVVLLVAGVTIARLIYIWWLCPYELVEDEAHYWEWSRRLGLSYYTKGPGVAWSIAAATKLLGVSEAAVRMPAVIAAAVSSLALAGLARDVFGSRKAGYFAASLFNLTPVFQFTSLLMTIDSPYFACWSVACWAGWRSMGTAHGEDRTRRLGWWALLGASLGIGFLFKYTIVLAAPGVCGGAWLARRGARAGVKEGDSYGSMPWAGVGTTLAMFVLCSLPVIIWNWQQGWPTVRHLLGHLGVRGGDVAVRSGGPGWTYEPRWTLELVAVQAVLLGAVTMGLAGSIAWARKLARGSQDRAGAGYLVGCTAPILLFYLGVTFFNRAEGNWPVAGFMTLVVLAGGWMSRELCRPDAPVKSFCRSSWSAAVWAGMIVGVLMLRVDLLARLPGIGSLLPVGRLIGAREQARHVNELAVGLRDRTGRDPLLIVQHYGQASRLAFYLEGRPVVFCSSSFMGGRRTQYDYWSDTDLTDPALAGRPGVLVGGVEEQWKKVFGQVESIGRLRGETKKDRQSFLGIDYRGFKRPASGEAR